MGCEARTAVKLEPSARLSLADAARLALVVVPVGGLSMAALVESRPSLGAVRAVVVRPGFWESYTFTVTTAVIATAMAAMGAAGVGFVLARRARPPRGLALAVLDVNLAMPHLVWAVALAALLTPSGWVARLVASIGFIDRPDQFPILVNDPHGLGIIIHLVTKELPFVLVATLPLAGDRLRDELAQAATLGAPPRSQFRHVYLPRVAPAFVPAVVVVLAFALGGYEPAAVLGVQKPRALAVVAVEWFRDPSLARREDAYALGSILVITTAAIGGGFAFAARRWWWPRRGRSGARGGAT